MVKDKVASRIRANRLFYSCTQARLGLISLTVQPGQYPVVNLFTLSPKNVQLIDQFLINLLPRLFEALPHLGVITLHCRLLDSVCQSEQNDTLSGQIGERHPLLAVQRPEVRVPARVPLSLCRLSHFNVVLHELVVRHGTRPH